MSSGGGDTVGEGYPVGVVMLTSCAHARGATDAQISQMNGLKIFLSNLQSKQKNQFEKSA